MPKLSPAETRRAERLLEVLEEFRRLDPDMQMPMAATLMLVALNDGISRTEVMNRLGVAGSTATRNLMGLMSKGRLGRPGHGLVDQKVNPEERRWRMHSLTPEGWQVVYRLLALVADGSCSESGAADGAGAESASQDPSGEKPPS